MSTLSKFLCKKFWATKAGGIGVAISNVRASGSYVRGTNGYSNGLVPMLRNFNETARYVDQGGGKRKGSFAMYLRHSSHKFFQQSTFFFWWLQLGGQKMDESNLEILWFFLDLFCVSVFCTLLLGALKFFQVPNPVSSLDNQVFGALACRYLWLHWAPQESWQGGATCAGFVPWTLDPGSLHEASEGEQGANRPTRGPWGCDELLFLASTGATDHLCSISVVGIPFIHNVLIISRRESSA